MSERRSVLAASIGCFFDLREQLARVLGVDTAEALIDRALTEVEEAYPALEALRRGHDSGSLEESFARSGDEEVVRAFNTLTSVILLILARMLGRKVAEGLADEMRRQEHFKTIRS
jgi:hypothetical protein